MDLGTIQFDGIGIRHNMIWGHWNKAQFNFGPLEQGTIQFDGIGIRHNSICDNGIGHKHYFGLCLIPSTWNELCLIPTYSVSCVPNSIHTIVPYSVGLSSVTLYFLLQYKKVNTKETAAPHSTFLSLFCFSSSLLWGYRSIVCVLPNRFAEFPN